MTESTTPQLTEREVEEIEARADAATPGPWLVTDGQYIDQYDHHPNGIRLLSEGDYDANYHVFSQYDVAFIAHARTDIPALCRTLRAKDEQIQLAERLATNAMTENAALREQLGEEERECNRLALRVTELEIELEKKANHE